MSTYTHKKKKKNPFKEKYMTWSPKKKVFVIGMMMFWCIGVGIFAFIIFEPTSIPTTMDFTITNVEIITPQFKRRSGTKRKSDVTTDPYLSVYCENKVKKIDFDLQVGSGYQDLHYFRPVKKMNWNSPQPSGLENTKATLYKTSSVTITYRIGKKTGRTIVDEVTCNF